MLLTQRALHINKGTPVEPVEPVGIPASNTLPTFSTENWLVLSTRYDYMALPIEIGVEVLKHMRMMTKTGSKWEISSNGDVQVSVVNGETMTVALVKARMLPVGDKED